MQRIQSLILVAAMSAAGTVTAASVVIKEDGITKYSGTLTSVAVNSQGDVTVAATGGTVTDPVVTDPVVTDPVVTDPVVTDPVVTDPVDCPPLGTEVIPVDTRMPTAESYPSTLFKPLPEAVYAFKFGAAAGTSAKYGAFTAAKTSLGTSKTLVVSACPGSKVPVMDVKGCLKYTVETTTVEYSVNVDAVNTRYYCPLEAGKTYYVNAFSKSDLSSTAYNCSNTTNCGFTFNGY